MNTDTNIRVRRRALVTGTAVLALAAGVLSAAPALASAKTTNLHGTLQLAPGKYVSAKGKVKAGYAGSYFRMILPGGLDQYFTNANSKANDKTYTLFVPGKQGGLVLGKYQPPPTPAFSSSGDALASSIVKPEEFAGVYFSISTAPVDAQGGQHDPTPSLELHGTSTLTGNFDAWTAGWNSIYFNQGSPKPGGAFPGFTKPVTGTYNAKTHAFTIVWYSQIIGGPFNDFTGYWHLQGTLKP
ncbi:MAG TPA: hypothetical protein VGC05_04455 [Mycobacterium sp.]